MYNDTHHLTIGIMNFHGNTYVPLSTRDNVSVSVSERNYKPVAKEGGKVALFTYAKPFL